MAAVIFDMDGVLVDSELHWKKVGPEFLQELVPTWDAERQRCIWGMSLYDVYDFLLAEHQLRRTREEFLEHYRVLAQRIYGEQSNLLPGARLLVENLAAAKLRLAVASSAPRSWIEICLKRFELGSLFEVVISSDHVGRLPKPAPDIYLHAAEALQLSPAQCVAVEDTAKGVRSAKEAGMCCVALRNGFNDQQDLAEADLVVEDLGLLEVEDFLKLAEAGTRTAAPR